MTTSDPYPYITGGAARLHRPADPSKPISKYGRRVIRYLALGGQLLKQRRKDPRLGRRHLPHPDPERYYYLLHPPREHAPGWRPRELPPPRRVKKEFVAFLVERGFLARTWAAGPDEATGVDLTPKAIDVLAKTDIAGNWLREGS